MPALNVGSAEHKALFCREFVDTFTPYEVRDVRWPELSEPDLQRLRALPFCHDDGLRFFVHAGVDLSVPLDQQEDEVMVWMREPFLSHCDEVDCGRFIVHGHTPLRTGTPDLRKRRINLDTRTEPVGYLTARDMR